MYILSDYYQARGRNMAILTYQNYNQTQKKAGE
jgi:hypothetical protein